MHGNMGEATNPFSESPLATKRISDDIQHLRVSESKWAGVDPLVHSILPYIR